MQIKKLQHTHTHTHTEKIIALTITLYSYTQSHTNRVQSERKTILLPIHLFMFLVTFFFLSIHDLFFNSNMTEKGTV